jgi:hypothetical protein
MIATKNSDQRPDSESDSLKCHKVKLRKWRLYRMIPVVEYIVFIDRWKLGGIGRG